MLQTIDTTTARRMAETGAIFGAAIIGQPGGWSVMLKTGTAEKPLGAVKTDRPRMWRSIDTLLAYLRKDLQIVRIDSIDATHHSEPEAARRGRPDQAARMRRAHAAAAHDTWFRAEVEAGLKEANDPDTAWIPHEEVMVKWAKRRALLTHKSNEEASV